jgi:DNA-binding MarR family transcriptional regulator
MGRGKADAGSRKGRGAPTIPVRRETDLGARAKGGDSMDWIDEFSQAWAREYPDTDTSTLSPMTRLVRLGVLMDNFHKETLEPFELTPSDYAVLSTLRRVGPPYQLSPSELYTALERSSGGMTKMLKRLEGLGLVERVPDPQDGRSLRVVLTESGLALQEEVFHVFLSRTQELLQTISPSKLREIDSTLRILLDGIESHFYR